MLKTVLIMITLLLLFLMPIAIWYGSALLGLLSKTLGMLAFVMSWCWIASMFLGPWVFVVGLLWVAIARISYDPAKEN
jgi:hypothetical protein